jgi:hypothetical protein
VSVVCEILDCARSSYYHRPAAPHERGLQQAIEEVAAAWPRYGYRRVTHQLRREGWTVNHKRGARLMRERGPHIAPTPRRWLVQYHYSHPLLSRLFLADRSLVVAHSAYFLPKWELFRYSCMAAAELPKATRLLKSSPKCSSLFLLRTWPHAKAQPIGFRATTQLEAPRPLLNEYKEQVS